jgi:hypothetical protein
MASYLFVDVDTLLSKLRQRGISIDLFELANKLRGGAALAAGLTSSTTVAVAIANWEMQDALYSGAVSPQRAFSASGFALCSVADRHALESISGATIFNMTRRQRADLATNDSAILPMLARFASLPAGGFGMGEPTRPGCASPA